jgi:hypothetical protein
LKKAKTKLQKEKETFNVLMTRGFSLWRIGGFSLGREVLWEG